MSSDLYQNHTKKIFKSKSKHSTVIEMGFNTAHHISYKKLSVASAGKS